MKKLITIIATLFIIPLFVSAASVNTSYDTEKCILTVSGNQEGHEAVTSLFNKNGDLLGLKTGEIKSDKYSVQFVLTYNAVTNIDITVANEDGNNEINKLDVNIPVCQLTYKTIFSDNNDSLTILDPDKLFEKEDSLYVEYLFDFDGLDEDEKAMLNAIKSKLSEDQKFAGIMVVGVINNNNEKEIPETNKGYELFLKLDKDTLSKFSNPYMARVIIDGENIKLDDGLSMNFIKDKGGVVNKINNVGIYVLYDDLSKAQQQDESNDNKDNKEKSSDNKPNPKTGDIIFKYIGIAAISGLGIICLKIRTKKNPL